MRWEYARGNILCLGSPIFSLTRMLNTGGLACQKLINPDSSLHGSFCYLFKESSITSLKFSHIISLDFVLTRKPWFWLPCEINKCSSGGRKKIGLEEECFGERSLFCLRVHLLCDTWTHCINWQTARPSACLGRDKSKHPSQRDCTEIWYQLQERAISSGQMRKIILSSLWYTNSL